MDSVKRVAGVEPFHPSGVPPAHDIRYCQDPDCYSFSHTVGWCGHFPTPPHEAFARHFFRCFFCRIGDNRIEDHFCETGRELMLVMLDEIHDRTFA